MQNINLGKIKLTWKGAYNSTTPYQKDDLVSFMGSVYICIQNHTNYPVTNLTYWNSFASGVKQLSQLGDLLTHNGSESIALNIGAENNFLRVRNGLPAWGLQDSRPGMTVKKLMQGSNYGNQHVAAFLMTDGSLRAIGRALNYSNADTNNSHTYLPQTVPINYNVSAPFKAVYRNYANFFALTEDGRVYSWGHNEQGVLGLGHTIHQHHAVCISWFVTNNIQIKDIVCPNDCVWGTSSTYFITTTGELYACGDNRVGQLGNGTITASYLPVRCGNLTGVKQVSVSCSRYSSVFVIDGNDDLWAWGHNPQGQLGLGDTSDRHSPTKVSNMSNVKQVYASGGDSVAGGDQLNTHVLALLNDGTVYSSGHNAEGQLGVGDNTDRHSFTLLSGSLPVIKNVYANGGYYGYSAALDENDNLWTWGYNSYYGVLGLGDTTNRNAPSKVAGSFQGNIDKVILGGNYSYAQTLILDKSGRLWGAGYNGHGQLALSNSYALLNPNFTRIRTPFENPFVKIIDAVFAGNTGDGTLYALTEDGRVLASGHNAYGQCGTQAGNLHQTDALYTMLF